jgi:hypothetical protein
MSVTRPQAKQCGHVNPRIHAGQYGEFHSWLDDSSRHSQVMEPRVHDDVIDRVH